MLLSIGVCTHNHMVSSATQCDTVIILIHLPLPLKFVAIPGSSSPSSSDDEIKEAFEVHPHEHRNPSLPNPHLWGWGKPSGPSCTTSTSGCSFTFEPTSRPVPVSHHKHKFFAQMSTNFSERPYLDFNKMQHSKRLVMVSLWHVLVNLNAS